MLLPQLAVGNFSTSAAAAAVLVLLLVLWLASRRRHYTLWSRQGIAGPPPNLLFGNLLDYIRHKSPSKAQTTWFNSYSPSRSTHCGTIGYFLGALPALVTTDPDLIRAVCIKDFDSFVDRQRLIKDFNPTSEPEVMDSMIFCPASRFSEMRNTVNKSFTAAKLRGNVPLIQTAIDSLLDRLGTIAENPQEINLKVVFGAFSADVIARCAFGLDDSSLQKSSTETNAHKRPLLKACDKITEMKVEEPFLAASILFPGATFILKPLMVWTYRGLAALTGTYYRWRPGNVINRFIEQVVALRDSDPALRRQDLLQSLMDSRDSLSPMEVTANGTVFYVGGYETTSTTMAFMFHYLIKDLGLQERIAEEVKELIGRDGKLDYNTVGELPLLDAVLKETLRLHPPVTQFLSRDAIVDYQYRPATAGGSASCTPPFVIPKRTTVVVGMQQIHMDPEYWTSPEDFRPERFMSDPIMGDKPAINPLVYMPFGLGQRNCVGQRFAILNIKLTVAQVLTKFRFAPSKSSELGHVTIDETGLVQHPARGVWARVEKV